MEHYDIIVVGGGVNSLITAAVLGQSGKKVLLVEAQEQVGGLASTTEFAAGYKCNLVNDVVKWVDPRVMKILDLGSYGLELTSPDIVRIALDINGQHILFHRNADQTATSISTHSKQDAKAWKGFTEYINNLTKFLEKLYELTPPKLPDIGLKEALSLRSMLSPVIKQGTRGLVNFMRVAPMMMPELMDEWFESELLRGALSTAGIHHITQGPFSAATGLNLLHQHVYAKGVFHNVHLVKGGTGNLAGALRKSAQSSGVKIRTNAKVKSIDVANYICSGVTLTKGESLATEKVVSGLDPRNTFINLIGAVKLNPRFHTQIRNLKFRGSAARVHFALNSLPEINGVAKHNMGTVFSVAPSISYLEKAYDASKYGQISENPYVEFTLPSVINPGFAPYGKHVLSATVQYAPYHLRGQSWTKGLKDQLKNNVVRVLENYIPNFSTLIEAAVVLSPVDLEEKLGLTEGNLNHGEMTLDQFFFMRPTMSSAQYKSPIENLYLCGPGTHPGGGLHGTNGFNAAHEILKRQRR
ncbi:MAG: NAD(P)/FAD-dependent oxidoreductase [Candidatus Marinimicrobia bacterium]|nr:NAD(P)/FAD-dependent oxidoreductase [Candidatus Neomarinimicrobiota bacterium]